MGCPCKSATFGRRTRGRRFTRWQTLTRNPAIRNSSEPKSFFPPDCAHEPSKCLITLLNRFRRSSEESEKPCDGARLITTTARPRQACAGRILEREGLSSNASNGCTEPRESKLQGWKRRIAAPPRGRIDRTPRPMRKCGTPPLLVEFGGPKAPNPPASPPTCKASAQPSRRDASESPTQPRGLDARIWDNSAEQRSTGSARAIEITEAHREK